MEELQVVAHIIAGLGAEARFAFVAWLIAKYGSVVACVSLLVWGFSRLVAAIAAAIAAHSKAAAVAREVAQYSEHGYWDGESSACLVRCLKWVQESASKRYAADLEPQAK